jgi:alpha-beta hydrolase superfamily lysophospholipase
MKKEKLTIGKMPAILLGEASDKVYLYIHGMGGCKEEAEGFAKIAAGQAWQVLSIDLPEHGERAQEKGTFNPWSAMPEFRAVMEYAKARWKHISLFANSIGAYFSMLSFDSKELEKCLFLSPILDMELVISNMMLAAGVSEERLQRELTIPNPNGPALSWEYLQWVRNHPITEWSAPTSILYGSKDILVSRETVDEFAHRYGCKLTVLEDGEHWFHTDAQMKFLYGWADYCMHEYNAIGEDK